MALFGRRELTFSIPTPCQEDWDQMALAGSERFCRACQSSVLDVSSLTKAEATRLLQSANGPVCGRIVQDERGNMVFRPGRLARIAGMSLAGVAGLAAQSTCDMKIDVKDHTGAVVEQATVIVRPSKGEKIIARESATRGTYSTKLAPGHYQVEVSTPDLQTFRATDVEVACRDNQPTIVKAELRETITVGMMVLAVQPEPSRLPGTLDRPKK